MGEKLRKLYTRFLAPERTRLIVLLSFAFGLRLLAILPYGNGISLPFRDQNTYYSLARALVDDGYLGVPTIARGPYVAYRNDHPRPPGFYPAFHDSMAAVWDAEGYLYGVVKWGEANSFFEPLYPLLSAGLYMLFGDRFFFWRLVHVIMSTALVYLIYDIGKRAFRDERVGTIAGFYTAVYPHFIFYAWILMAEGFLLLLLALGMWAYVRMLETPRWTWAAAMGLAFGGFVLTRSFLIAFFPLMLILVVVFIKDRNRWVLAGISLAVFILTLLPWMVRNYALQGEFVLMSSRGGYNIWMRNNPYYIADELEAMGVNFPPEKLDKLKYKEYILRYPNFSAQQGELERNAVLSREGIKFIRANPGFFLEMCWIRFKWTIGWKGQGLKGPIMNGISLLSYGPALLGFLVSILLGWKHLKIVLPFWLVVGYFILFYSLTHEGLRYRVPIDPYMIILAVFSALYLYDHMKRPATNG
jgi:4-amino-4-deoxy-L-arabinose transferase-like glycosyltransferase